MRTIYGYDLNYEQLLKKSNLKTMEDRRVDLFKKFKTKTSENLKYQDWFPLKDSIRNVRRPRPYLEEKAKTERLYRSPIYAMRSLLNNDNPVTIDPEDLSGIYNIP